MSRRRILSIDGGGIKGVFPVAFLAHIESALNLPTVRDYFDLIAGTSVGGIIALGLGLGLTAQQMTEFFVKYGPEIFPRPNSAKRKFRLWMGKEKYDPAPLKQALEATFGNRILNDSSVRLLIPSFDANGADIHIYKTAHHSRLGTDYRLKAVEVAMATAAAPTYFPALPSQNFVSMVDGGIWANNPVAFAVVEGTSVLGWNGDEIDVLSLGCTEEAIDFNQKRHSSVFWALRFVDAASRGQSRSATGIARHLTGRDRGIENVFRYDPPVAANRFSLDGVGQIDELRGLAYSESRKALSELQQRFFLSKAEPFTSLKT